MTERININYRVGIGDYGMTHGSATGMIHKSDVIMDSYNALERWVVALQRAHHQVSASAKFWSEEDDNSREKAMEKVLDYLRNNSFVIGAYIFFAEIPEKASEYSFDPALLGFIDNEIDSLCDRNHDFYVHFVQRADFNILENLRLSTRELEVALYRSSVLSRLEEDTANAAIINRLSNYVYHYSCFRAAKLYPNEPITEWTSNPRPKFEPYD